MAWYEEPGLDDPFDAPLEGERIDEDRDEEEDPSAETALREVISILLWLRFSGKLSAKMICIMFWWLGKAGLGGPNDIGKYSKKPGDPSEGNYQKFLDRALGFQQQSKSLARLNVPGWSPSIGARVVHQIAVVPPAEALHAELAEDSSVRARLREAVADGELPPAYHDHAVVRRFPPATVLPLSLYLDGTPYSKKDSVLGVFVCNILSGARHLICILRKANICRCGCRGWCSLWPIMAMLHWSFAQLAVGEFDSAPSPGLVWDEYRESLGGGALLLVGCLLHIKLDWKEASESMGFPNWGTLLYPCLWCTAERDSLHTPPRASASTERLSSSQPSIIMKGRATLAKLRSI